MRTIVLIAVALVVAGNGSIARGDSGPVSASKTTPPTTSYSLDSLGGTGAEITGPATIRVTGINPLRYDDPHFIYDVTTDSPVDVSAAFGDLLKSVPSAAAHTESAKGTSISGELKANQDAYLNIVNQISSTYGVMIKIGREITQTATSIDDDLRMSSDLSKPMKSAGTALSDLATSGPNVKGDCSFLVIGSAPDADSVKVRDTAPCDYTWPSAAISSLQTNLMFSEQQLSLCASPSASKEMATTCGEHEDSAGLVKAYAALQKALDQYRDGGQLQLAYQKAADDLVGWYPILARAASDSSQYELDSRPIDCSNGLDSTHTQVIFKASDRLDASQTREVSQSVVTVNCYSRLSLTHGGFYGKIRSQDFAIGSAPGMVNTIQSRSNSPDKISGIPAMVHYRLWGDVDGTAVHFSMAVASSTQGMAGLSVSFHRTIFLTVGLIRSMENSLTNGFSLGQRVPAGTVLNTTSSPVYRLGFAISFPLSSSQAGGPKKTPDTSKDNPPNKHPKAGGGGKGESRSPGSGSQQR